MPTFFVMYLNILVRIRKMANRFAEIRYWNKFGYFYTG